MTKRADALRGFPGVAYLGWRDVMADPAGSLAIYKKAVPEIDADFIAKNMALGVHLMRTPRFAEHGIGWIEAARMRETAAVVNTYMASPKKVDPDAETRAVMDAHPDLYHEQGGRV